MVILSTRYQLIQNQLRRDEANRSGNASHQNGNYNASPVYEKGTVVIEVRKFVAKSIATACNDAINKEGE